MEVGSTAMRRVLPLLLLVHGCSTASGLSWGAAPVTTVGPAPEILSSGPTWLRFRVERDFLLEVPGTRTMALFPGLEYLEATEPSSGDRRSPDPAQVTVPLMAYEVGGVLVALMWKDGAKPTFEAREKNRMGLAPIAGPVEALLLVEPGATVLDAVPRWTEFFGGLPEPEPWPRTLEQELALCKAGLASVAAERGKHRHAVGKDWPADWTPGFGVLLHLLGEPVDWFDYSDLLSTVNCHLLRWEAPFYAGEPGTVKKLVERMQQVVNLRNGDEHEWGFHPTSELERRLGTAGEIVLGTSSQNALAVAKAARMTGDPGLKSIALDVLARMRRHRVPRGGRSGEGPIREPDLLSAAFAVGASVEAWKLSGDAAYLADARRWAKSGLPFLYLWNLPARPGMRYGAIPAFSTSNDTKPWFGVPVQWNGLVYAYYLRKLAPHDKSFDWLRVAEGITASAVQQQYADGPSKGCSPDSLADQCRRRAPPDLNPEELLVNILTSIGKDPDPDLSVTIPATQKR